MAAFNKMIHVRIWHLSLPGWTGLVWIVGVAIYALAVPIVLTVPKNAGQRL